MMEDILPIICADRAHLIMAYHWSITVTPPSCSNITPRLPLRPIETAVTNPIGFCFNGMSILDYKIMVEVVNVSFYENKTSPECEECNEINVWLSECISWLWFRYRRLGETCDCRFFFTTWLTQNSENPTSAWTVLLAILIQGVDLIVILCEFCYFCSKIYSI